MATWLRRLMGVQNVYVEGALISPRSNDVDFKSSTGSYNPATRRIEITPGAGGGGGSGTGAIKARVATTANITLSGEQTIDGVLTAASRVLVKNQGTPAQNGVYLSAAGAWARVTDFDTGAEVVAGALVTVEEGSTQADTVWMLTTNNPITVGVTGLTFELRAAAFGAAPVNVTKAAAAAGTANTYSRSDHKHDITTAVVGALNLAGVAAAEGSATSLARSDHTHSITGTVGIANGGTGLSSAGGNANRALFTADGSTFTVGLLPLAALAQTAAATGQPMIWSGTAWGPSDSFGARNLTSTGTFAFGAAPADSGALRFSNTQSVQWRNSAGSGNIVALTVTSSNETILGTGSPITTGIHIRLVSTRARIYNGSSDILFDVSDSGAGAVKMQLSPTVSSDNIAIHAGGSDLQFFGLHAQSGPVRNLAIMATGAQNWQSGDRIIFIPDRTAAPTGNPSAGGFLYSAAGALIWRGSGGTITTVAPA